jgi:hypothetical protein
MLVRDLVVSHVEAVSLDIVLLIVRGSLCCGEPVAVDIALGFGIDVDCGKCVEQAVALDIFDYVLSILLIDHNVLLLCWLCCVAVHRCQLYQ